MNNDFNWHCEDGLINNMTKIVKEFCEFRGLSSKRLFISGPAGSGKSFLTDELSKNYNIPGLNIADVIEIFKKEQFDQE